MVDIPRCKYLKIYFCLGEIEMKVQFCTACKDYWNGHKKVNFFLFPNWPKYLQAQTQFVSSILYMEERERKTRVKIGLLYFFFLLSNCPKFKVKKRYGRPWKSKNAHVVVVPFLRNLRVAYHKFFISITTTYLHSVVKFLKKVLLLLFRFNSFKQDF